MPSVKRRMKKRIAKCPWCFKEFETTNKTKKYCSDECRNKHLSLKISMKRKEERRKEERKCIVCGRILFEYQQIYCSSRCRNKYYHKNKVKPKEEKKKREKKTKKIICPWEAGLVEGTAKDADPILGF